jgi:MinD-like ATPase involved in chromosome partitioning or flagellar assembly
VDAYAVIKLLTLANRARQIGVLVNAVRDERQAAVVFGQLSRAADRFLGRTLRSDGFIVEDQHVRASALGHVPLADGALGGPASRCFRRLAARLATWRPIVPGPGPASPAVPGLPTGMATVPEGARCA